MHWYAPQSASVLTFHVPDNIVNIGDALIDFCWQALRGLPLKTRAMGKSGMRPAPGLFTHIPCTSMGKLVSVIIIIAFPQCNREHLFIVEVHRTVNPFA